MRALDLWGCAAVTRWARESEAFVTLWEGRDTQGRAIERVCVCVGVGASA